MNYLFKILQVWLGGIIFCLLGLITFSVLSIGAVVVPPMVIAYGLTRSSYIIASRRLRASFGRSHTPC